MKRFAPISLAFASGTSARAIESIMAEHLNMTSFPYQMAYDMGLEPLGDTFTNDDIICETSTASPLTGHVLWIIENLLNEDDDNLCFSAMVGMSSTCGPTLRHWSSKGDSDGGAAFQFCRTDRSGASNNCKGGRPGKTECIGDDACGGYYPIVVSWFINWLTHECWTYTSDGEPRVGGIFKLKGGELRVYRMPG